MRIFAYMTRQKKNIELFISHTHMDVSSKMNWMESFLSTVEGRYTCFCSSKAGRGVRAGENIMNYIDAHLAHCATVVCFITEAYLRSPYCLYELALCRHMRKRTVLVVHSGLGDLSKRVPFLDNQQMRIQLEDGVDKCAIALCQALQLPEKTCVEPFAGILAMFDKVPPAGKAYVGMPESVYSDILKYVQENEIVGVRQGFSLDKKEMLGKVENAKAVYIVSTTGAALCKQIKEEILPACLLNGVDVHYILPGRDSDFCRDVAHAEEQGGNFDSNSVVEKLNVDRIYSESDAVSLYLNEAVLLAQNNHRENARMGTITCYCSRTLLRQTIQLVVGKDGSVWGWVTMTLPPLRSIDSLTITIKDGNENKGLAKQLITHCNCLMDLAVENKETTTIEGDSLLSPWKTPLERDKDYWEGKKKEACLYMQEKKARSAGVLIEIAAQHPLFEGRPNAEFEARLRFAMSLGKTLGNVPIRYYVPGSIHNGDPVSLSKAGTDFLLEQGIPADAVFGEDMNNKFKGKDGVYNSADECFVASRIFQEGDYGRLVCVCSPYQTMRKTFNYLEFGVFPECYGIAAPTMFHDVVSEYFGSLRTVVHEDHGWQDEKSEAFIESRMERCPGFALKKK